MCAKLLNTIIESIYTKGEQADAARIAKGMFHTSLEKVVAIVDAHDRLKALKDKKDKSKDDEENDNAPDDKDTADAKGEDVDMEKSDEDGTSEKQMYGWRDIEQAMPVNSVAFANESF